MKEQKYRYEIRKKVYNGKDEVLSSVKNRLEIPYEIELLGYKDAKTKIDENGTKIYYKGKNEIYIAYTKI